MILVIFNNKIWTACLAEAVGTWMSSPLITGKKIKMPWLACQPRIGCVLTAKPIQPAHQLGQLVLLPWELLGETGSYSLQFLSLCEMCGWRTTGSCAVLALLTPGWHYCIKSMSNSMFQEAGECMRWEGISSILIAASEHVSVTQQIIVDLTLSGKYWVYLCIY